MMCGGASEVQDATAEIHELCELIREDLEGKVGKKFNNFKAKHYRSQVVAGTNFFVKIEVDDEHIHVRIFRPLPHTGKPAELHSFQAGKSAEEEVAYF